MTVKNIMSLIPTLQATALVGENIKETKKKKPKKKSLVKLGVGNIVGIELIKLQSGLIK